MSGDPLAFGDGKMTLAFRSFVLAIGSRRARRLTSRRLTHEPNGHPDEGQV
jgi:hypothetical protein